MLTTKELAGDVERGAIDTVVVAFTDMQGRLMGKRLHATILPRRTTLRAWRRGLQLPARARDGDGPRARLRDRGWERGYGDSGLVPDLATLRRIPWLEATALVLCRRRLARRLPVAPSPRQVLKRQVERAPSSATRRCSAPSSSSSCSRRATRRPTRSTIRDLTPSVPYILDYHVLAATYDEPLIRQIRNGMQAAGIEVETSKGEAWPGSTRSTSASPTRVAMADNHAIYKNGAKEIAHLNGCSITFMAKPDHTWIGNSCHIHSSLWRGDENAFAGESEVFKR